MPANFRYKQKKKLAREQKKRERAREKEAKKQDPFGFINQQWVDNVVQEMDQYTMPIQTNSVSSCGYFSGDYLITHSESGMPIPIRIAIPFHQR